MDLPPFLSIVAEKVSDLSRRRRWARKNILGGFAASVAGHKAKVVDMSYGGFRLEMPAPLDDAAADGRRSDAALVRPVGERHGAVEPQLQRPLDPG